MAAQESAAAVPTATPAPEHFTELIDYVYPPLKDLDFTEPSTKIAVVTAATVTSIVLYVITQAFFMKTSSLYRNLRLKERVFWNLAMVRSCFGLFCIMVGLWAIFAHTALDRDFVWATTPSSHVAMGVTTGFFLFECLALTLSDVCFQSFSGMLQVHHWISLVGFLVVMVTDSGHTLGCRGMILEMSTPFSCLCWTLLKAGRERSLLWKANQFLLVHSFHLRNVVEVMLWVLTWQHWGNVWTSMPWSLFVPLYGQLILVTFVMTPYWTYKKTKQMICPVDWNFENAEVSVTAAEVLPAAAATTNTTTTASTAASRSKDHEYSCLGNGKTHIGNGYANIPNGYTNVGYEYVHQNGTGIKED